MKRIEIKPLPENFDEETADLGYYDSGQRKRDTYYEARYCEKYDNVEQQLIYVIAIPGELPSEGQGVPYFKLRADGCRVLHFWEPVQSEKERIRAEQEDSWRIPMRLGK
jgi:hypothetical protein